ncbi:sorting nexin-1/2, partial [Paragonimus westermani]
TNGCSKPFDVNVTYPVKVGDGMSAYIVYHVVFTGHQSPFDLRTFNVTRRFSDFLGLHAKLLNQYQCTGVIIPSAPDKNVLGKTILSIYSLGTTMVKMSKDASLENEFIERRRIALERYFGNSIRNFLRFLYRLLSHPVLRTDTNLREFLEHEGELPRSVNTQLISGASAKKMFRNFGDVLGKITYKMEDPEEYFDLKTEELESWERQLKRLHGALTSLVTSTQDLVSSKFAVSRAISQLANVEEHTGLAQALGRLADTEENVSQRYAMLADAELMYLADCARDTLGIIQACKYFDLKTEELESWERQLKRLHGALTSLVTSTQDLVSSKFAVSRAISQLANVEEHTGLAQALGRLADTEENVSQRYAMLADAELMYLADCARDTLGIIQACKDALDERWKTFRNWKSAENALRLKRELKVKLELAGRCDQRKAQGIDAELEEISVRVENEKNNFEKVTQVVKVELDRVDFTRFDDLKQAATQFLQIMLQTQEKLLENWESYLLQAKTIN